MTLSTIIRTEPFSTLSSLKNASQGFHSPRRRMRRSSSRRWMIEKRMLVEVPELLHFKEQATRSETQASPTENRITAVLGAWAVYFMDNDLHQHQMSPNRRHRCNRCHLLKNPPVELRTVPARTGVRLSTALIRHGVVC